MAGSSLEWRRTQHVETEDFRAPMNEMTTELLCDVTKLKLAAA